MQYFYFFLKTENAELITHWHFLHFQLYKIRPKRTRPQALLFLCMILLLIVLHTSYMIYSLAPQYVMYGSQKYLVQVRKNVCTYLCISRFFVSNDHSVSQWVHTTLVQLGIGRSMVSMGLVPGLLDSCSFYILFMCI